MVNAPDRPSTLGDYLDVLRRRRRYLLTIIPAALLIAIYLAYALPPSYRSSATILFESSTVPEELVATTVSSLADQQIEIVQRRVMTAARLEQLVTEDDPYPEMRDLTARDKADQILADTVIERVDPITLEVLIGSNAFSIHYHNADPKIAAKTSQRLADLFLDYNRETRKERAAETYNFLLAQSKDVERKIDESDQRIEKFRSRYADAGPESQGNNLATIDRLDRDLRASESQIRIAEERQALLKIQLSQLNPTLAGTTGNWRTELTTLQAQLAQARIRYTPDHPDVKRLQRQIEALSAKAASEGGMPEIVPDNPEYLAVQSQLNALQHELNALRSNAARSRSRIGQFESRLSRAPAVDREYSELTRVRESLLAQFADLQNKLAAADVSLNLESEHMGARFTQIRVPSVPNAPYSPNRVGMILLGLVLGSALAAGLAALAESLDPSVRSARDLRDMTAVPAIAAVPVLMNAADYRKRLILWASYAGALAVAVVIVGLTIATAG